MTLEELAALKTRIATADQAKTRIERLRDAAEKLSSVSQLRLAFNSALHPIQYATSLTPEPSWQRVCWAEREDGLAEEVLVAVVAIIKQRLTQAEAALLEV